MILPTTMASTSAHLDEQFASAVAHGVCPDFTIPSICTATIVFTLNKPQISLQSVLLCKNLNIRTQKKKNNGKTYRPFSNAITVIFDKTKTIKVFSNGRLHTTGCTHVVYAESLVQRFILAMEWSEDDVKITETKILTLNSTFRLMPQTTICLQTMFDKLKLQVKDDNFQVRYTPDIYQGLVLKTKDPKSDTKRNISVLFFYTGSIILCGVREPHELEYGITFIHKLIRDILPSIAVTPSLPELP